MAITQSVVHAVCERMGDAPVRRVCPEIGTLFCVVPDLVRLFLYLLKQGTTLEGASLEIV